MSTSAVIPTLPAEPRVDRPAADQEPGCGEGCHELVRSFYRPWNHARDAIRRSPITLTDAVVEVRRRRARRPRFRVRTADHLSVTRAFGCGHNGSFASRDRVAIGNRFAIGRTLAIGRTVSLRRIRFRRTSARMWRRNVRRRRRASAPRYLRQPGQRPAVGTDLDMGRFGMDDRGRGWSTATRGDGRCIRHAARRACALRRPAERFQRLRRGDLGVGRHGLDAGRHGRRSTSLRPATT